MLFRRGLLQCGARATDSDRSASPRQWPSRQNLWVRKGAEECVPGAIVAVSVALQLDNVDWGIGFRGWLGRCPHERWSRSLRGFASLPPTHAVGHRSHASEHPRTNSAEEPRTVTNNRFRSLRLDTHDYLKLRDSGNVRELGTFFSGGIVTIPKRS